MCCLAENAPPNLLDPKDEEKHVEMAVVCFFFSGAYHQFCLRSHMDQWDCMDLVEKNMSDVPMKY